MRHVPADSRLLPPQLLFLLCFLQFVLPQSLGTATISRSHQAERTVGSTIHFANQNLDSGSPTRSTSASESYPNWRQSFDSTSDQHAIRFDDQSNLNSWKHELTDSNKPSVFAFARGSHQDDSFHLQSREFDDVIESE